MDQVKARKRSGWLGVNGVVAYMALAIATVLVIAMPAAATAPTLPDAGVDVGSYVSVLVTTLGAIIATAIGATFAFFAIKVGLRWILRLVK